MPAGDRTGPASLGPMTGRGAGYCGGYGGPGFMNRFGPGPGLGRRWGRGWGGGWRWRHWGYAPPPFAGPVRYAAPPTREDEMSFLKAEAEWLKSQLEAIGERIEELGQE